MPLTHACSKLHDILLATVPTHAGAQRHIVAGVGQTQTEPLFVSQTGWGDAQAP